MYPTHGYNTANEKYTHFKRKGMFPRIDVTDDISCV